MSCSVVQNPHLWRCPQSGCQAARAGLVAVDFYLPDAGLGIRVVDVIGLGAPVGGAGHEVPVGIVEIDVQVAGELIEDYIQGAGDSRDLDGVSDGIALVQGGVYRRARSEGSLDRFPVTPLLSRRGRLLLLAPDLVGLGLACGEGILSLFT